MSNTGLDVFDTSVHETNLWLKIVMEQLATDDRRLAFAALRATLHALRDRIGVENAIHLGAQLPMLLRGAYYEGWRGAASQTRERHIEGFLAHVAREISPRWNADVLAAIQASLIALADRLDPGEVRKLHGLLPAEILPLWRAPRLEPAPSLD